MLFMTFMWLGYIIMLNVFISIVTESYAIARQLPHYDVQVKSLNLLLTPIKDAIKRWRDYTVKAKAEEEEMDTVSEATATISDTLLEEITRGKMTDEMMLAALKTLGGRIDSLGAHLKAVESGLDQFQSETTDMFEQIEDNVGELIDAVLPIKRSQVRVAPPIPTSDGLMTLQGPSQSTSAPAIPLRGEV
jgi:urease gamma subunit